MLTMYIECFNAYTEQCFSKDMLDDKQIHFPNFWMTLISKKRIWSEFIVNLHRANREYNHVEWSVQQVHTFQKSENIFWRQQAVLQPLVKYRAWYAIAMMALGWDATIFQNRLKYSHICFQRLGVNSFNINFKRLQVKKIQ